MERRSDDSEKWPVALWIGVLLTVIWFAILAAYAVQSEIAVPGTQQTASTTPEAATHWHKFWHNSPDAFGNALAGAFAPLAFLWLVVATFIQKDELRLQVKELRNTVAHLGTAAATHLEAQMREARKEKENDAREQIEIIARRITDEAENYVVVFGAPINPRHFLFGREEQLTKLVAESNFSGCLLSAANAFDRLGQHYEAADIAIYCDPHLESLLIELLIQITWLKETVAAIGVSTWDSKLDAIGINILAELIEEFINLLKTRLAPMP